MRQSQETTQETWILKLSEKNDKHPDVGCLS